MSIYQSVKQKEVQLTLEIRVEESITAYNTATSSSIPIKYENVPLDKSAQSAIDSGGAYVSTKVNYGTISQRVLTSGEERQAGIMIIKAYTPKNQHRFLAMDILDACVVKFKDLSYPNFSLMINALAPGVEGQREGEYWTEKLLVYFDYIK